MLKKGEILNLRIESLAFEGPGVAKYQAGEKKMVIFVDGGVAPSDFVEVQIVKIKKNLARGFVRKFLEFSPDRILPKCAHFGRILNSNGEIVDPFNVKKNCGGCSWQFLDYPKQLEVKRQMVIENLNHLGGQDLNQLESLVKPIISMEEPWYYRNKMEFSFLLVDENNRLVNPNTDGNPESILQPIAGQRRAFGLHMKNRHHDLTEIDQCHLFKPWSGAFVIAMREFFENLPTKGKLDSLTIRAATNTGEVLICLNTENLEENLEMEAQFVAKLNEFFQKLENQTLVAVFIQNFINIKGQSKKTIEKKLWGADYFQEKLFIESKNQQKELLFRVKPQAFLQPNTLQAQKFYGLIGDLIAENEVETVYDLFCGTGTIGIFLANRAKKVIGVELNASAIEVAKENAILNQIENIEFIEGDVAKVLEEVDLKQDLIIVDPPRAGLNPKLIEKFNQSSIEKLIYVSCNPTTLARDIKLLNVGGFVLKTVQPVDQFAHTYHIENVCLLSR